MNSSLNDSVLFIDDEQKVLNSLQRQLNEEPFMQHYTSSQEDALEIIRAQDISVIICDMRMPGMNGVELLARAAAIRPDSIRIVLSGYSDANEVMSAINDGQIWRYISKPWKAAELILAIQNALDLWNSEKQRGELIRALQQSNDQLHDLNNNLEDIVRERTTELYERSTILEHIVNSASIEESLCFILTRLEEVSQTSKSNIYIYETAAFLRPSSLTPEIFQTMLITEPQTTDNLTLIPLHKSTTLLGVLVINNSAIMEHTNWKLLTAMIKLLEVSLSQYVLISQTPKIIGDMSAILRDL